MAQSSNVYAATATRVREGRLLTEERLLRMLDAADAGSVMNDLKEMGYGSATADTFDEMIAAELLDAADFVKEVTPNKKATDAFLLKYDCNNIKLLLKSKMAGKQTAPTLSNLGTVPAETLLKSLESGRFSGFSPNIQRAAATLYAQLDMEQVTPSTIDFALDKACYADMAAYAQSAGQPQVVKAVAAMADTSNLLMLARVKQSGGGVEDLVRALLPGGIVQESDLVNALSGGEERLLQVLPLGSYDALRPGLSEYVKTGKTTVLEKLCDDYVTALFKKAREDFFSEMPVLGYWIAKEREAQAVRLLMVAKTNNLPANMVKERLRELL